MLEGLTNSGISKPPIVGLGFYPILLFIALNLKNRIIRGVKRYQIQAGTYSGTRKVSPPEKWKTSKLEPYNKRKGPVLCFYNTDIVHTFQRKNI